MTASRMRLGARSRAVARAALLSSASHASGAQSTAAAPTSAQHPRQRAGSLLIGSVLAGNSGSTPIAGAEVLVQELGLRTQTDEIGNYALPGILRGTQVCWFDTGKAW